MLSVLKVIVLYLPTAIKIVAAVLNALKDPKAGPGVDAAAGSLHPAEALKQIAADPAALERAIVAGMAGLPSQRPVGFGL
jgi:hypothetical protein